ncbi:MAG: hypothetical protein ACO3A2_02180 [Bdellovibrionia bacterium]
MFFHEKISFAFPSEQPVIENEQISTDDPDSPSDLDPFFCNSSGDLEAKIFEGVSLEDLKRLRLCSKAYHDFLSDPLVARKIRLTRNDTLDQVPSLSSSNYFKTRFKIKREDQSVQLSPNQHLYLSNAIRIQFDQLSDYAQFIMDPQSKDYTRIEFDFSKLPAQRFFSDEELRTYLDVLKNWTRLRELKVIFNSNRSLGVRHMSTDSENLGKAFKNIKKLTVELVFSAGALRENPADLGGVEEIPSDFDRSFFICLDEFYLIFRNQDSDRGVDYVSISDGFIRKKSIDDPLMEKKDRQKISSLPDDWRNDVYRERRSEELVRFLSRRQFPSYSDAPVEDSSALKNLKHMKDFKFYELIEYQFRDATYIQAVGRKMNPINPDEGLGEQMGFYHEIFQAEEILKARGHLTEHFWD